MEVQLSSTPARPLDGGVKILLGLLLMALALLPGAFWPPYFRYLTTAVFVGIACVSLRGLVSAIAVFRPPAAPPPKAPETPWPTVSVLVVAYNEATVLPRTMAALQKVDYPADRIEFVYVYERRSTDATGPIVQAFAAKDPRFVALERDDRRGGKAAACNFGLDRCTGEILVSLDADQALAPDAVTRAVRWFLSDPAIACVKGRPLAINGHESYLALGSKLERDVVERGELAMRGVVGGFAIFGGGQAFFRRDLFTQLGPFDEEVLVEDVDFSVKIHEAGHRILVDPAIHSFEEHPAGMAAWWAQRKRWSRGWMQITRRYTGRILGMRRVPWRARLDLAYTLAFVLIPLMFTLMLPLNLLGLAGADIRTFVPGDAAWWTLFGLMPVIVWTAVWLQDRRDGIPHAWRELPALAVFGLYLSFQAFTVWSAFLDEFILQRPSVYVKTAKTGVPGPHRRAALLADPVPES